MRHGVMAAAAIIFFAFYGFDAVSTAAEETKNPAATCRSASSARWSSARLIYIAVAAAAIGAMPTAPSRPAPSRWR
jgi:APA family basic amino acid/polyamine antiporter